MKNIPIFTASQGLATLILREIPYSGRAYILVRSVWNGQIQGLLEECAQFCRMAGAETVYGSWGVEDLPGKPAYDVLELSCRREDLPSLATPVELFPLTRENGEAYRDIYNRCFRDIAGATAYDRQDIQKLLGKDMAYLAKQDGEYVAAAERTDRGLASVAVLPEAKGMGYGLTLTVLQRAPSEVLTLRVSGDNERALRLYRRLGFGNDQLVSRWWEVEV